MSAETPGLEIRRATSLDLPAIEVFLGDAYGAAATYKNTDRWIWQFCDAPGKPPGDSAPSVWIACEGPRVVGQIAVQDARAWFADRRIDAGWIVDVMVLPAFRGQGLGHRIHAAVVKERAMVVTLTMAPATRRMAERAACVTLGPTSQYIRPHALSARTVSRYLSHKIGSGTRYRRLFEILRIVAPGPRLLAAVARLSVAVPRLFRRRSFLLAQYDISEFDRFDAAYDQFWQALRPRFPAIHDRSAESLNWRFCECPGLSYRKFILRRGGDIRGVIITRVCEGVELPAGIIVDILCDPEDAGTLDALIELAQSKLNPVSEYLEAAASTPLYRAALQRAGFRAVRTMRPTVVCEDEGLKAEIEKSAQGWHFTKGDHDWDQIHPV
jgi:GNAT superfamily N-acetyltransferase